MSSFLMALAVWRITSLLMSERGLFDIFEKLREMLGIEHDKEHTPVLYPENLWGGLFGCFWCLSMWVSIPFALLVACSPSEWLLLWLANSTGAIVIEEVMKWLGRN